MARKLKTVEALPDKQVAEKLLGFSSDDILDEGVTEVPKVGSAAS